MVRVFKRIKKRTRSYVYIFINRFIKNGKKDLILKKIFKILIYLKKKKRKRINLILKNILYKIKPIIGLKPKFAAGLIYLLPTFIHPNKEVSMGLNWLNKSLKQRKKNKSFFFKFLNELELCYHNKGYTLKLKREFYQEIVDNRDLLYRFSKRKK